jgi:hypothetical protein
MGPPIFVTARTLQMGSKDVPASTRIALWSHCAGIMRSSRRRGERNVRVRLVTLLSAMAMSLLVGVSAMITPGFSLPDRDLVDLYEYTGKYTLANPPDDAKHIELSIPQPYRYGSMKNAQRTWVVEILTYYPSFTSASEAEHRNAGLDCAGICDGRILISIEYRPGLSRTQSPNWGDYIAQTRLRSERNSPQPENVEVRDIGARDGFDFGYERLTRDPHAIAKDSAAIARTETVLLRKAPDGTHFDLAATCERGTRTTCVLHFSLECDSSVYVAVNGLDASYLDRAGDLVKRANAFLTPMFRSRSCNS